MQTYLKTICYAFVMLLVLTGLSVAQDKPLKIGIVDPAKVFESLPEGKTAQKNFENFAKRRQESLATRQAEFEREVQVYQERQASYSQAQLQSEQARLGKMNEELREAQYRVQQELQRKEVELMQPLEEMINNAIAEIAKKEGFDFILNANISAGEPVFLFIQPADKSKLDLTDKIIAKLTKP